MICSCDVYPSREFQLCYVCDLDLACADLSVTKLNFWFGIWNPE